MDKKLISQRLHQIEMFLYRTIKYTMLNFIVTPPTSTADGAQFKQTRQGSTHMARSVDKLQK